MTSWCLAGQRLSTAVRVGFFAVSRQSACARAQTPSTASYTRSFTVCGAGSPALAKSRDTAPKSKHNALPKKAAQDSFFAPDNVTFESLRLSPAVIEALHHGGFIQPSTVQVCCLCAKITVSGLVKLKVDPFVYIGSGTGNACAICGHRCSASS